MREPSSSPLDDIAEWIVGQFGYPFDTFSDEPPPECLVAPLVAAWRRSPLSGDDWTEDEEAFYVTAVREGHD